VRYSWISRRCHFRTLRANTSSFSFKPISELFPDHTPWFFCDEIREVANFERGLKFLLNRREFLRFKEKAVQAPVIVQEPMKPAAAIAGVQVLSYWRASIGGIL